MIRPEFSIITNALKRLSFLMGSIILITGCASMVPYTKTYSGPELPISKMALLTQRNPYLRDLVLLKVDGKEFPFGGGLIELLPGDHTITTMYYNTGGAYNTSGTASVEFTAEAGHVYEMYPVLHNHDNDWYIGIWDVTNELNLPEKKDLSEKIDKILEKNRTNKVSISSINPDSTNNNPKKLAGFGENMKATITGMKGNPIEVEYKFDRYKPFIIAEASDSNDYHLQISPNDGSVEQVLGIRVTVGDYKMKHSAFHPINSDAAYVYSPISGKAYKIYTALPDGSYILEKNIPENYSK